MLKAQPEKSCLWFLLPAEIQLYLRQSGVRGTGGVCFDCKTPWMGMSEHCTAKIRHTPAKIPLNITVFCFTLISLSPTKCTDVNPQHFVRVSMKNLKLTVWQSPWCIVQSTVPNFTLSPMCMDAFRNSGSSLIHGGHHYELNNSL